MLYAIILLAVSNGQDQVWPTESPAPDRHEIQGAMVVDNNGKNVYVKDRLTISEEPGQRWKDGVELAFKWLLPETTFPGMVSRPAGNGGTCNVNSSQYGVSAQRVYKGGDGRTILLKIYKTIARRERTEPIPGPNVISPTWTQGNTVSIGDRTSTQGKVGELKSLSFFMDDMNVSIYLAKSPTGIVSDDLLVGIARGVQLRILMSKGSEVKKTIQVNGLGALKILEFQDVRLVGLKSLKTHGFDCTSEKNSSGKWADIKRQGKTLTAHQFKSTIECAGHGGHQANCPPIAYDGDLYVPLAPILDEFGFSVD